MKDTTQLLTSFSSVKINLTFSRNVSEKILKILDKFSGLFIGQMKYDFDSGMFSAELEFDNSDVCCVFRKFYLEKETL